MRLFTRLSPENLQGCSPRCPKGSRARHSGDGCCSGELGNSGSACKESMQALTVVVPVPRAYQRIEGVSRRPGKQKVICDRFSNGISAWTNV